MQRPRLVLMCGLPGSGKTTLARRLEARGLVRFSPDEWMHDLAFDQFDDAARTRVEALQLAQALRLLELGTSVVLENGFWTREERAGVRDAGQSAGAVVELHHLDATLDELWCRLERRNAAPGGGSVPIALGQLQMWAGWFEVPDAAELATFDEPGETLAAHAGAP